MVLERPQIIKLIAPKAGAMSRCDEPKKKKKEKEKKLFREDLLVLRIFCSGNCSTVLMI